MRRWRGGRKKGKDEEEQVKMEEKGRWQWGNGGRSGWGIRAGDWGSERNGVGEEGEIEKGRRRRRGERGERGKGRDEGRVG